MKYRFEELRALVEAGEIDQFVEELTPLEREELRKQVDSGLERALAAVARGDKVFHDEPLN